MVHVQHRNKCWVLRSDEVFRSLASAEPLGLFFKLVKKSIGSWVTARTGPSGMSLFFSRVVFKREPRRLRLRFAVVKQSVNGTHTTRLPPFCLRSHHQNQMTNFLRRQVGLRPLDRCDQALLVREHVDTAALERAQGHAQPHGHRMLLPSRCTRLNDWVRCAGVTGGSR